MGMNQLSAISGEYFAIGGWQSQLVALNANCQETLNNFPSLPLGLKPH